jgi:hypothetical protein
LLSGGSLLEKRSRTKSFFFCISPPINNKPPCYRISHRTKLAKHIT